MSRQSGRRLTNPESAELYAMVNAGATPEVVKKHFSFANYRDARRWVDKIAAGWTPEPTEAGTICAECGNEPRVPNRAIGKRCVNRRTKEALAAKVRHQEGERPILERRHVTPPRFAPGAYALAIGGGRPVYGRL